MRNILSFLAILSLLLPLAAGAAPWELPYPRLGACTRFDTTLFRTTPFSSWEFTYDSLVNQVTEGIIGNRLQDPFAQRSLPAGSCSAQDASLFLPAPSGLANLAMQLEPWRDLGGTPQAFTQADTAPVLLELLRVYECAHIERIFVLPADVHIEEYDLRSGMAGGYLKNPLSYMQLYRRMQEDTQTTIDRIGVARPTMERTLNLLGGLMRMRALEAELDCVQRASLDISASLALGSEASACIPRVWNAKDPLRDQPECSDGKDNDGDGKIDLADDSCATPSGLSE